MPRDHRVSAENNQDYLTANAKFQNMPERIQGWVLASPHASADFAGFFRAGGDIKINNGLPYYHALEPPQIVVDSATYNLLLRPDANLYIEVEEAMFANLAHEIGHHRHSTATELFEGGTSEEYVQYRSKLEATTVFNAFPIFDDLQKSDPEFRPKWSGIGYGRGAGVESGAIYQNWRAGRIDDAAAIAQLAKPIPDFPYTRDDSAGNQFKTWRDFYLYDFQNLKRSGPTLPSDVSGQEAATHSQRAGGIEPSDPSHRDHAMYQQVRAHVQRLDAECGRTPDDVSDRLTASLMCLAKTSGLRRVDHVVLSEHKENGRVVKGENVFVVQGRLDDPAHCRGCMKTVDAVNSPEQESYRQLDALNHQLDQQQALQRQRDMQQAQDVHQHVMRR